MTSQQFAISALISLIITVFTVISTIYPAIFSPAKDNNNINREIIRLRDNLSLSNYFPFNNFDDYHNISEYYTKLNTQTKDMHIFMSILAFREGKIFNKDNRENFTKNDSMEYYLKNYSKDSSIEHTNIIWYPLRQLKIANESKIFNNPSDNKLNEILNETLDNMIKKALINKILDNKTKEEDFYCNDLKNNSIIDNHTKNNNIEDTSYCSIKEIKNIREYSENYPYVISIMNDNVDNKIIKITDNFRQISNYFKWIILFSFISGPIVFFLLMKKLY